MFYLHSKRVLHLHLSSTRVLVNEESLSVKVMDYALSTMEACLEPQQKIHMLRGCTPWSPPEVLRWPAHPPAASTDVYAFGVILWELITRQVPFEGLSVAQLVVAVGFARHRLPVADGSPPELGVLSRACARQQAARRPSFRGILGALKQVEAAYSPFEESLRAFLDVPAAVSVMLHPPRAPDAGQRV